jgi:hypothetical protein
VPEDIVRTKRIELTDENGNTTLVVTGTELRGNPGLALHGPDGPESANPLTVEIDKENGIPTLYLNSPGGGFIRLTFHPVSGLALIQVKNEDGRGAPSFLLTASSPSPKRFQAYPMNGRRSEQGSYGASVFCVRRGVEG